VSEDKLNEEQTMMLSELRVAVPGMQMLFAFLLTIPFDPGFAKATASQHTVFGADLLFTALSSVFLIAPALFHRLHWRRDVADKDRMLRIFNVLAIIGGAFLSLAIVSSMFLVFDYVFGEPLSAVATGTVAMACLSVWYGLPLIVRWRERAQQSGLP
jgi:hypothetical protein